MLKIRALIQRLRGISGAVGAQLAQALTTVVLSITAAAAIGAKGLGVLSLILSGLVLATAITSGLVGDSLVVLDRSNTRVRSGLQVLGVSVASASGVIGAIVCVATGLLEWKAAIVFGLGTTVFIIEELLRRMLMAALRFWSVMAVDLSCLVTTVIVLLAANALGSITMIQLLFAMLVAQIVGFFVAVRMLPPEERHLAPWRHGEVFRVFRYGGWRAAQQAVRPAMFLAVRILVVIAAGTIAFGELEAARVYTAPALVIIQGIAGFLFSTYAANRHRPLRYLIHRADVGAFAMFCAVIFGGAVAVALLPWLGKVVTGSNFTISPVAAFGWVVFSATAAVLMPYGSLASVIGLHVRVFTLRVVEALVSLAALVLLLFVVDGSTNLVPYAISLATIPLAMVIRQSTLVRRAREMTDDEPAGGTGTDSADSAGSGPGADGPEADPETLGAITPG